MYLSKKILALLGISAFSIAFAGEMNPTELQLREWRLTTKNLNAEMVPEFAGKKFVVKVNFPMEKKGKDDSLDKLHWTSIAYSTAAKKVDGAELQFSKRQLHTPLDNWIPPYISTAAREIRIGILPLNTTGHIDAAFRLRFVDVGVGFAKLRQTVKKITLTPQKEWQELVIPVQTDIKKRLGEITLTLNGSGKCELALTSPVIIMKDGRKYEVLNPNAPRLLENAPAPVRIAKKLPRRNQLCIGSGGPWWVFRNYTSLPELSRIMKEALPDIDIVLSAGRSPEPDTFEMITNLPENIFYQMQHAQHGIKYPNLFGALAENENGEMQKFRYNSLWAIHPIIQNALKDQIDYVGRQGINSFKVYDYVWLHGKWRWGYDQTSIMAFREDLSCKDEGLRIMRSKTKSATIHFADYFRSLHGMMPSPQDLGLKSWNEYIPVKTKDLEKGTHAVRLNYSLFLALCSYEWLRQAQRWNTWSKAYGGTHEYLLNLEAWPGAGDYINLVRLADSGIVSKEFFTATPTPISLGSIYSGSGLYLRSAARIGREMGICCEVTTGGGHGQPYWDAKVAYSIAYFLIGLGHRHLHHDHHDRPFSEWFDPKSGNTFAGVSLMMSQGRAMQQVLRDQVGKPVRKSTVLNVRGRSVGITLPPMMSSWFLSGEWKPILIDSAIDFEDTDSEELPLMLPKAGVVFYAPHATRKDSAKELNKWLKGGTNRTLVLHSVIPFREEKGYADAERIVKEEIPADAPSLFPGFAKGTIRNGTVLLKKSDGSPLLSEYRFPGGGRICYLHPSPEKCGKSDLNKVMVYLTKNLDLPLRHLTDGNAIVFPFEGKEENVYVMWNRQLAGEASSKIDEWHKKYWQGKRRYYDHRNVLYNWYQPGTECSAKVRVKKPGTYRLYNFLADRETVTEVGSDHLLPLTLSEALTEIVYAAPDTPEFRKKIAELRKERAKTTPYFRFAVDK